MKKRIISAFLLISLTCQSTYPIFEGLKKRFGAAISQAKNLLNVRDNIRCMRVGDNCSKEKRMLLGTISALAAALAAAGVAVISKRAAGKKEDTEGQELQPIIVTGEKQEKVFEPWYKSFDFTLEKWREVIKKGTIDEIPLPQVQSRRGETLVGAFLQSLVLQSLTTTLSEEHKTVLQDLLKVVTPSNADNGAIQSFKTDFGEDTVGKEMLTILQQP